METGNKYPTTTIMNPELQSIYLCFFTDLLAKRLSLADKLDQHCEESGDCMLWGGPLVQRKFPVLNVDRKKLYVKRHAMQLMGHVLGRKVVTSKCGNQLCVNPEHLVLVTKAKMVEMTVAAHGGNLNTPASKAKIAAALRAKSPLTQEEVADIRNSNDSITTIARRYDISEAYAYMLRRGDWRRDYNATPFSGLGNRP